MYPLCETPPNTINSSLVVSATIPFSCLPAKYETAEHPDLGID